MIFPSYFKHAFATVFCLLLRETDKHVLITWKQKSYFMFSSVFFLGRLCRHNVNPCCFFLPQLQIKRLKCDIVIAAFEIETFPNLTTCVIWPWNHDKMYKHKTSNPNILEYGTLFSVHSVCHLVKNNLENWVYFRLILS